MSAPAPHRKPRRFLISAALLVPALGLAACSSEEDEERHELHVNPGPAHVDSESRAAGEE